MIVVDPQGYSLPACVLKITREAGLSCIATSGLIVSMVRATTIALATAVVVAMVRGLLLVFADTGYYPASRRVGLG